MSEAIIAKKAQQVAEVAEQFKNASSVVVDYLGITVEQATNLRSELRKAGVQFAVVKNSILSRAAKEAGLEGMDDVFKGPSAVAFSNEDVVAPAKILADFAKKVEALEIKAGVVEGKSFFKRRNRSSCKTTKPRRVTFNAIISITSTSSQHCIGNQSRCRSKRWRSSLIKRAS